MKFFSKTTLGFYSLSARALYDAQGSWPADAVQVSEEVADIIHAAIAAGSSVDFDASGDLVVTPAPVPPFGPVAAAYLDTVRAVREQILNRLAGIGMAALLASDSTTAQAAGAARQALLDITKAPAVLAATDPDGLKAAVLSTYRAIVAAAPAALVKAFTAEGL